MKAGLTRRQVLHLMGLSAATITGAALLSACADDAEIDDSIAEAGDGDDEAVDDDEPDDDDEAAGDDDAPADDERPSLVVGVHGLTDTMDPNSSWALVHIFPNFSVFEMLFRRDFLASDPPGSAMESSTGPMAVRFLIFANTT